METKLSFIVLYIVLGFVSTATGSRCNHETKKGPYTLKPEKPYDSKLSYSREAVGAVHIVSQGITPTLTIGYRAYWWSYCYNGGAWDSNTGCYRDLKNYPPNESEIKQWEAIGKCKTGKTYIDQWGSDSDVCLNNNFISLSEEWSHKELNKYENNNHWSHHTCNVDWRCGVTTSSPPFFINCTANYVGQAIYPNCNVSVATPIGIEVLQQGHYSKVIQSGEFTYYLHYKLEPKYKAYREKIQCFYDPINKIASCIAENGDIIEPSVGNNWYCFTDRCYQVQWDHPVNPVDDMSRLEDLNKTVNVDNLKRLLQKMSFDNENLRYNLHKIETKLIEVETKFIAAMTSLAKIDDRLIGKMLGTEAESEFLGEEHFYLSPCTAPTAANSNCRDGSIFKDGRWQPISDPALCVNYNNSQPMYVFEQLALWMPQITTFNISTFLKELSGWTFVANAKDSLINTMAFTKNGGSGTSLEDIVNWPKGFVSGQLSSLFTSQIVSWVITIAVIGVLIKLCKIMC